MGRKIRMFTTYGHGSHERRWHQWDEDKLIGALRRGGPSPVDGWRPFDMLTGLERSNPGLPQLIIFEADDLLVGTENNAGRTPYFFRSLDHDELFLQFMGETTVETDLGVFHTEPGEMLHIPHGIAYRSTGSADSLRMTVAFHGKLDVNVDAAAPKTHNRWQVTRSGSPQPPTPNPTVEALPDGQVWEIMGRWKDQDPYWIVRDEAEMATSGLAEGGTPITVFRPFDYFDGITGKGGGVNAPVVIRGGTDFFIDVYNTTGEQFGFHRNLGADELWFHFAGSSHNDTEIGPSEVVCGGMTFVPFGLGHRTTGSPSPRMLMVLYHSYPTQVKVNPAQHVRETRFEVSQVGVEAQALVGAPR